MRIPYITSALIELKPNAEWTLRGDTYADLEWLDKMQPKPTEEEVNAKVSELEKNEPFRLLREERNKRLAECDWVVTKYAEYGYNIPKEWRAYRQALHRHRTRHGRPARCGAALRPAPARQKSARGWGNGRQ